VLFWGPGHLLQFLHVAGMTAVWLVAAAVGRRPRPPAGRSGGWSGARPLHGPDGRLRLVRRGSDQPPRHPLHLLGAGRRRGAGRPDPRGRVAARPPGRGAGPEAALGQPAVLRDGPVDDALRGGRPPRRRRLQPGHARPRPLPRDGGRGDARVHGAGAAPAELCGGA
jgi:hypothetical protein